MAKNTSPCTYSSALMGGQLQHHRQTWMAVSHGQYRDRRASNISQVILVRLTHPLLPRFRRRAPRGNPLIPPFFRRAPGDDHLLPLFRRRKPRVDAACMSKCNLDDTMTRQQQMLAKVTTTKQRRQKPDDKSLTTKLEASTHLR
jgi:hypothetical protein